MDHLATGSAVCFRHLCALRHGQQAAVINTASTGPEIAFLDKLNFHKITMID